MVRKTALGQQHQLYMFVGFAAIGTHDRTAVYPMLGLLSPTQHLLWNDGYCRRSDL